MTNRTEIIQGIGNMLPSKPTRADLQQIGGATPVEQFRSYTAMLAMAAGVHLTTSNNPRAAVPTLRKMVAVLATVLDEIEAGGKG